MSTASKFATLLAAPSANEDDEPNEDAVAWCDHKLQAVRECLEGLRRGPCWRGYIGHIHTATLSRSAAALRKVEDSMSKKVPTVDGTCTTCNRERKGTYLMKASCSNCGANFIVKISKGHPTSSSVACPVCEVSYRTHYRERVA